jgi:hypothetical protein
LAVIEVRLDRGPGGVAGKEKTGSALLLPSCAAGFTGGSRQGGPPYIHVGYWWSPTAVRRPPEPPLLTYFFLAAFFLPAFFAFFFVAMVHSFRLLVEENGDFLVPPVLRLSRQKPA